MVVSQQQRVSFSGTDWRTRTPKVGKATDEPEGGQLEAAAPESPIDFRRGVTIPPLSVRDINSRSPRGSAPCKQQSSREGHLQPRVSSYFVMKDAAMLVPVQPATARETPNPHFQACVHTTSTLRSVTPDKPFGSFCRFDVDSAREHCTRKISIPSVSDTSGISDSTARFYASRSKLMRIPRPVRNQLFLGQSMSMSAESAESFMTVQQLNNCGEDLLDYF